MVKLPLAVELGVNFSPFDPGGGGYEIAVVDLSRAVILEKGSAGDGGDLVIAGRVERARSDDQARRGLGGFRRRGRRNRRPGERDIDTGDRRGAY